MIHQYNTLQEWEPFVGGQSSPNTEYPQQVHVLKGSNTIKVSSKNLYLPTLTNKGTNIFKANCTVVINDETLIFTATGTDMYLGNVTGEGKAYTKFLGPLIDVSNAERLYLKCTNEEFTANYICFFDENKISLGFVQIASSTGSRLIPSNARYCTVRIGKANAVSGTVYSTKVMLSTEDTEYEPHREQIKTLTLPEGMEMCGLGDSRDGFLKDLSSGKWYKNEKISYINKIIIAAGPVAQGYYFTAQNYKIKINTSLFSTHQTIGQYETDEWKKFDGSKMGQLYPSQNAGVYINYKPETGTEFLNWWNSLNIKLYYERSESKLVEITNTTLIAELEDLYENLRTYYGQTNITVEAEDLPPIMTLSYKKSNRALRSEIDSIKARLDLLEE